jgi:hypothetical protein
MRPVRSPRRTVWRNTCATWQHRVTRLVAVAVIDALEVVHVHHERMRRHGLAELKYSCSASFSPRRLSSCVIRSRAARLRSSSVSLRSTSQMMDGGSTVARKDMQI